MIENYSEMIMALTLFLILLLILIGFFYFICQKRKRKNIELMVKDFKESLLGREEKLREIENQAIDDECLIKKEKEFKRQMVDVLSDDSGIMCKNMNIHIDMLISAYMDCLIKLGEKLNHDSYQNNNCGKEESVKLDESHAKLLDFISQINKDLYELCEEKSVHNDPVELEKLNENYQYIKVKLTNKFNSLRGQEDDQKDALIEQLKHEKKQLHEELAGNGGSDNGRVCDEGYEEVKIEQINQDCESKDGEIKRLNNKIELLEQQKNELENQDEALLQKDALIEQLKHEKKEYMDKIKELKKSIDEDEIMQKEALIEQLRSEKNALKVELENLKRDDVATG